MSPEMAAATEAARPTKGARRTMAPLVPHVFRGMDPSHVAMIDVANFDPNECSVHDQRGIMGMIDILADEITMLGNDDNRLAFRLDEVTKLLKGIEARHGRDHMAAWATDGKKLRVGDYTIRCIETSENDTPLPNISYDTRIEATAANWEAELKAADVIGDYAELSSVIESTRITSAGEAGEYSRALPEAFVTYNTTEPSRATYSIEYLRPFMAAVRAWDRDAVIAVRYATKKPMRVDVKVGTSMVYYYLAPKVDN